MALSLVVPKSVVFPVTVFMVQYIVYCAQPSPRSTYWFLALACFLPVWSSICRLRFWLPADESVLHAVESQIYGSFLGSGFSLSTVAGLGTVHVPYNGDESAKAEAMKSPQTLVLVHGYGAGNAFWAAGMYAAYYASKYGDAVDHLLLVSPAGVNPSPLAHAQLPLVRRIAYMFSLTPMVYYLDEARSTSTRTSWTPPSNAIRTGALDLQQFAEYCYHNWALEASGDIAVHTHLHPVRTSAAPSFPAPRTPLCDVLVPEKWALPVTFLYGGGPDWMPKEHGEAVVQRLQTSKGHYASFRTVPLSGHQVFMDNPSAFNRAVAQAVRDWELHRQNASKQLLPAMDSKESPRRPGPPQIFQTRWMRLLLLVLTPFFVLLLVLWGVVGRVLTLAPRTAGATALAITWVLYLCIPHIPVDLLDWPLVITAGIAIDVLIPPLKLVHGLVFVALVVYAAIRVSLTDGLVSGSTEKGLVDTLAVVCCVFPLWLSICSLHLWLPADGKVLDAVEKKIYEQYLVTEFSQTKVAGLGTIHVPYCGDSTQLPPRILVLVHGYMAGNAFWAALERFILCGHSMGAMYSTYFAEKYPARIEHLILISPAGVNSSGLKPEDLPSFLKFTGMFYITPMVGISVARLLSLLLLVSSIEALTLLLWLVRWSWTQRIKWTPPTNIVRSGELDFGLITQYCYHNWALQASGDIAFYTHLHPGASARRRALDGILTPAKLQVPLTIMYGGGPDWMNSEFGEAVIRRLEKTHYAVFRLVPLSGHQVFMDNPADFNQMVIQAVHDQERAVAFP
ncbi:hypothetical protein BBJ28_00001410 [Nothophytophthora sp. Chile5]|nr:hypothetical protein BBJ28_00001410 [Nothophytophthora sp. Chile5]